MSISSTGKAISPRQRRAKLKGETTVEVENNQGSSLNTDKIEPNTDLPAPESSGTLVIAGVRPIASSDLEVAETVSIAGVRPIGISHLQVVETINEAGIRPISANTFQIVDSISSSGIRPISSSSLVVSESYSVFGNRPVASNNIDDSANLMGFLD
ncbi:hypothetical protein A6770_15020 [Nostoc minutum NIES-26]|uniref:Uncharacterized protein n=1 Tax=Nostoc minutum NIES-26 TaxID=1844469 RepID=A0A367RKD8_9NOSO|nr:hypothetical protein [Dendronalium sp. ChiSLP03b]MDZ8202943.1 hypothetical protein [Dendronalium sp. ChiSLP03b]RCJ36935.1 hypothetical protein A6770_15020 [Nostoc minutum NIES-26]